MGRMPTAEEQTALNSLESAVNELANGLNGIHERLGDLNQELRSVLGLGPEIPDPRSNPLWISLHRGPTWEQAEQFTESRQVTQFTESQDRLDFTVIFDITDVFKERIYIGWRNDPDSPAQKWGTDVGVHDFWKVRRWWGRATKPNTMTVRLYAGAPESRARMGIDPPAVGG